jgi:hypothetical protein
VEELSELSARVVEPAEDTDGSSSDYSRRMRIAVVLDETCFEVWCWRDFQYLDEQEECTREISEW